MRGAAGGGGRPAGRNAGKNAGKRANERAAEPAEDAGLQRLGALETGRVTWLGLAVALIGWAMLLAVAMLADATRWPHPSLSHGDLMTIAQALIGSGFALAAIGSLQVGFGSLNRFFNAALLRSGARAAASSPPEHQPEPRHAAGPSPVAHPVSHYEVAAAAPRRRRPYRTLPDGSVEVETILGTRRFATMRDAREFI